MTEEFTYTASDLFFCTPGSEDPQVYPQAIDAIMIRSDGEYVGKFSGETLEEIQHRYSDVIVMSFQEYNSTRERMMRSDPVEITREQYMSALGALPPMRWGTALGVESFRLSEFYSGHMTNIFARCGGRYWQFMDDAYMPAEEIAHKVGKAMQKEVTHG